jgi:hypothetical protein
MDQSIYHKSHFQRNVINPIFSELATELAAWQVSQVQSTGSLK